MDQGVVQAVGTNQPNAFTAPPAAQAAAAAAASPAALLAAAVRPPARFPCSPKPKYGDSIEATYRTREAEQTRRSLGKTGDGLTNY